MIGRGVERKREHNASFIAMSTFQPGRSKRMGGMGAKGIGRRRPAWSEPMESSKEMEQEKGKRGTLRKDSLTKMKSMREGLEFSDQREMVSSGTVEMKS